MQNNLRQLVTQGAKVGATPRKSAKLLDLFATILTPQSRTLIVMQPVRP